MAITAPGYANPPHIVCLEDAATAGLLSCPSRCEEVAMPGRGAQPRRPDQPMPGGECRTGNSLDDVCADNGSDTRTFRIPVDIAWHGHGVGGGVAAT